MDTTPTTPDATVTVHAIPVDDGMLHVTDQPGRAPTFLLMHGFPDDSRIYGRLAPLLAPQRVVTFDFMGYGRSDRPDPGTLTADRHHQELGAVLDALDLDRVVLVGHDASGPIAIDTAMRKPQQVEQLILLNSYYGHAPSLRLPEMIRLLSDHEFAPLADAMIDDPAQRLWLLGHTAQQFGLDPADPDGVGAVAVLPQFFGDTEHPHGLAAIRGWTTDLFNQLDRQDTTIASGQLRALDMQVTLVFGADDHYLTPALAHHLANHFSHASTSSAARHIGLSGTSPRWSRRCSDAA
jgi:haloalkane dehalogenase